MTTLDDYTRFLSARWYVAERRQLGRFCKWDSDHCDFAADCPDVIRADLAAKRAILQEVIDSEDPATWVLMYLAAPFRDHPDHPANQETK